MLGILNSLKNCLQSKWVIAPLLIATVAYGATNFKDIQVNGTATVTSEIDLNSALDQQQIVTPANPAAGRNKLYFKNDNSLYSLTSGGVETQVGAASANQFLSNLMSPTAINQHLLPNADNGFSLGSSTFHWQDGHITNVLTQNLQIQEGDLSDGIDISAPSPLTSYSLQLPSNDGNASEFLQTDGAGILTWAPVSGFANTALSNLIATSINQDLVPSASAVRKLGNSSFYWQELRVQDIFSNADLTVHTGPGSALQIFGNVGGSAAARLYFRDLDSTNFVGFKAPDVVTSNFTWTLPAADGTAGQFLQTDGAGTLSFQPVTGFANTSLSNLGVTAVNANILPSAANTRSLGTQTLYFNEMTANNGRVQRLTLYDDSNFNIEDLNFFTASTTTPSGTSQTALRVTTSSDDFTLFTTNDAGADAVATGNLFFETGNKTAGTGDSGDIRLRIGTSTGGARGSIKFVDGSEGTVGHIWTQTAVDGSGEWQAAGALAQASTKNYAQNADFRFWQRQVPATLTARTDDQYSADRWYVLTSAITVSSARVAEVITASPSQYVAQVRQGDSTSSQFGQAQILEHSRVVELRGKASVFSFYARTDGTEITTLRACLGEWTGTADAVTSDIVSTWGATPTFVANFACINTPADLVISSAWSQHSVTGTFGASMNNVVLFVWTPNSEVQNDDFYITQTQALQGSSALSWDKVSLDPVRDLKECQRYYEKSYDTDSPPGTSTTVGIFAMYYAANTANYAETAFFKVQKRLAPSMNQYDAVGNLGQSSYWQANFARVDNVTSASSFESVGLHSILVRTPNATNNNNTSIGLHWTAEAEL